MNSRLKAAAALVLAACVAGSSYASDATPPAKKTHRKAAPKGPSVDDQIQSLRQDLQNQINELKSDLASKDAQLKQAQQQAADAQAAAARAQDAANTQQQAVTENQTAVNSLQSTVTDLKANASSLAVTVSDENAKIKQQITSPDAIYFKGITLSPTGSFLAAETVWRQGATGGDINTAFTGVPLDHADAAQLSEFQGTGRQSRLALKATGKLASATLTGYYEMDWLGTGITSNNNQSNSYVLRMRQLWADARFTNGWDFSAGQGWSLATETTKGLQRTSEILPSVIDPQYTAGFVWTRQYGARVTKDFGNKFFVGISAENAETLNPAGANLPTNLLIGSPGVGGGLYNSTANYSFNLTPDFVAKLAVEPGWGHWEAFGIGRSFRDRIYPTAAGATPYNDTVWGGGIGGGFRGPLASKKVSIGLKGLWGQGVGRYGSSTIADVTLRPDATISPLHGFSALSTLEFTPTPRLTAYLNYGADYIGRNWAVDPATGKKVGYGTYDVDMSGCNVESTTGGAFSPSTPSGCKANNKDVQEFTAGYSYNLYKGPKGTFRYGLQYALFRRDLWSGNGGTTNPGNGAKGTDNMFWTQVRYYLP
ncbi:MAG TPA: hypothetical protein VGL22_04975 [Terracidiphilus sp.]